MLVPWKVFCYSLEDGRLGWDGSVLICGLGQVAFLTSSLLRVGTDVCCAAACAICRRVLWSYLGSKTLSCNAGACVVVF